MFNKKHFIKTANINFFFFAFVFISSQFFSQNYTMSNGGSISSCSGTFLDPGGTSNYSGGTSTWTYTICNPTPGLPIYVDFTTFSLWSNSCVWGASVDELRIYNGTGTTNLIGSYSDNSSPSLVVGSSGCLTFQFIREDLGGLFCDENDGDTGWSASISCTPPPPSGTSCFGSYPFCTGTTYNFPNSTSTTAITGPNYACLNSQPNPVWYYMRIDQAGTIQINISQTTGPNGTGSGLDVDFALWGPFTSLNNGCSSIQTGNAVPIQSSFSSSSTETVGIGATGGVNCSTPVGQSTPPAAQVGQYYILIITNYSGSSGYLQFSQTAGTGSADCSFVCGVNGFTAIPTTCDPATNTYTLNGNLSITNPPTTGTLTITNGTLTQVFNAPFSNSINYTFPNLPSDGGTYTVTTTFSANSDCNTLQTYTAPGGCIPTCTISAISANTTPCVNDFYNVSGNVTFTLPPSTGTLTISNSCGGTPIVLNPPFNSPIAYNFNNLTANGANCNITAVFSANSACTRTQPYSAPIACVNPPCVQNPFCSGTITFPAGTNQTAASITYPNNEYDCLGTTPNPEWYYMQIAQGGNLNINMSNSANVDIDFIMYGPYSSYNNSQAFCDDFGNNGSGTNTVIDCSYSGSSTETASVPNAQTGEVYILLITNYSNTSTNISFTSSGSATTDCNIVTPSVCLAEIGTFNTSLTGDTQAQTMLCFGDQLNITSNNDFVTPSLITGGTAPVPTYDPGVSWLVYSCPPTVALTPAQAAATNTEIADDPCFIGIYANTPNLTDVNDMTIINGQPAGTFTNNTVYFVPITMYSIVDGLYSYVIAPANDCYELGTPIAIQYLPEIVAVQNPNCANGTVSVTLTGGAPQVIGTNFNVVIGSQTPASATFVNTSVANGGTIILGNLTDGPYSFDIVDDNGCPVTISGDFVGPQSAAITYPDVLYCLNEPNPLPTLVGNAGGTYTSGTGLSLNATTGEINLATSTPGAYAITYTTPGNQCPASSTFNLTIEDFPIVEAGPDLTVCVGKPITLNASGASSYSWNNGLQNNVPYLPNVGLTQFVVIGTSTGGCIATDSLTVTVIGDCDTTIDVIFWVPNTFTPDGDQYNQTFFPVFDSGYDPYSFDFFIYNRWGELIWESHDVSVGWDGTYNDGMKCPDGTYTWKIKFKLLNNDEKQTVLGHVNLIR